MSHFEFSSDLVPAVAVAKGTRAIFERALVAVAVAACQRLAGRTFYRGGATRWTMRIYTW